MAQEEKNLLAFMSSVDELYKPSPNGRPGDTGFDVDFQSLKRLSAGLKQSEKHKALAGQSPENKKKNRYKDITPFDYTRVKLTVTNDDPNSDYINASFIKGAEGHKNYIASQGPLPYTVLDFWQMLWQYNVGVIVMVCREFELGKKKCERYWADKGETKNFAGITVALTQKEELADGYCLRTIKAQKGGETRYIQQFHYTSWPDHGVPKTCYEIITLINHFRDVQSYSKDETTPLCVHCSAGCGRTGAVLAVDYVRNLLEKKIVPPGLKTYDIIAEMRRQRPAIVQTKDQYEFVNTAVSEMFRVYLQTHSLTYKGFRDGYQKEEYVNINIKSEVSRGTLERPSTLYENVSLMSGDTKNGSNSLSYEKMNSFEDYPSDSPPAKPSRVSNPGKPATRPGSNVAGDPAPQHATYANYGDRKQSAPAVFHGTNVTGNKVTPSPTAKPRTPNFSNARSPTAHTKTLSGPPKDGTKPPLSSAKPKQKPEVVPKTFATTPPPKPSGNQIPNSPLHGKSAPSLSSPNKGKSNFHFPLTSGGVNDAPTRKKKPQPLSPVKPNLVQTNSKVPSPVREKVCKFESKERILSPLASPVKAKVQETVLKITEENDPATDSEADSPGLKSNFVKLAQERIKTPPPTKPKPNVAAKFMVKDTNPGPASPKNFGVFLRPGNKPKPQLRPVSQNFVYTTAISKTNMTKNAISVSVVDLSESKKAPPLIPPKTTIVRSASMRGVNAEEGEENFKEIKAKLQAVKKENENGGESQENENVSVKVQSYTQADASYGLVVMATGKKDDQNGKVSSPTQRKLANYRMGAPAPFKPPTNVSLSRENSTGRPNSPHIGENNGKRPFRNVYENTELNTGMDGAGKDKYPESSGQKNLSQSSLSCHNYVNTPIGPTGGTRGLPSDRSESSSQNLPCKTESLSLPRKHPNYVNTQIGLAASRAKSVPDYENHPAPLLKSNPPPVPPQSRKPLKATLSDPKATNERLDSSISHGFVQSTLDEGSNTMKPSTSLRPKAAEETKKKAPVKPQRSVRRQNAAPIKISAKDEHVSTSGTTSGRISPPGHLKKYNKKNLYNEISFNETNDVPQIVPEADYEYPEDNVIPRSNSNASVDRSSSRSSQASTPPRLPTRTAESQILIDDGPPALPTRTADSYIALEDDDYDLQAYEAVNSSTLSPNSRSSNADAGRRPSNTSTSGPSLGTSLLASKAKNMFEKTTSAFSKVSASISKTVDDDSSGSPVSTLDGRKPTYVQSPVVYNGKDMSFGQRLVRKVRGGRKAPKK